jgi:arylformamidase
MAGVIDISPVVGPRTAVWPGDVAFSRQVALSMADGDHLELSSITTTVHIGAHADAPSHYRADGPSIEARDPALYIGPCQVIAVDVARGERIPPLSTPIQARRVLLKTGTFPEPERFDRDFAALSVELVDQLAAAGVRLVGIDTPSVDLCDDQVLLAHNAIARHDLAILEGVVLDHVDPGLYTLSALPLPLAGCDASPVRAVLLPGLVPEPLESR